MTPVRDDPTGCSAAAWRRQVLARQAAEKLGADLYRRLRMIVVDADGTRWRPEDYVETLEHAVGDGMAPGTAMEVLRTKLGGMSAEFYRDQRERFEIIAGMRDGG